MAQQPTYSYQQPAASHDPYGYAQVPLPSDQNPDLTLRFDVISIFSLSREITVEFSWI